MSSILDGFNAKEHDVTSTNYGPIAAGTYEAMIIDTETKPTKAGTGRYLELTFEITGPEHAGRKIWERLNLENPNEKAVEIAQRTLAQICHAIGVLTPKQPEELQHKPLSVVVGIEDNGSYGPTNRIKVFAPVGKPTKAKKAKPVTLLSEPDDELPF